MPMHFRIATARLHAIPWIRQGRHVVSIENEEIVAMVQDRTALVLGATGGIGGAVTRGLLARGWQVRALHRDAASRMARPGLRWVQGDATDARAVSAAATGVRLIVHAV